MQISQRDGWQNNYFVTIAKSFLLWTFTLTVCFLVVGFPVVVILMTVGILGAIILQSILPASAILVVTGSILGSMAVTILLSSLLLTLKGIDPRDVRWLGWLHDSEINQQILPLYASCPLTCDVEHI
ncbi:hypothetical protein A5482_007495 [Cyanobacterium sp. IPPAS B-1200]|uniref:hypothetical protein n=1 Tax=Cyanobacterium sp. IPPAS B-1200 TaxID=1562720 RepID=UPI0008525F37|nr:hypothetical protein [Cyanobacterium sp. IPPAS B-1200]OEJ78488.1 hypothetical protein A5482_12875 [Cyanobacterium sp. IPPAS B-1200]